MLVDELIVLLILSKSLFFLKTENKPCCQESKGDVLLLDTLYSMIAMLNRFLI